MSLVTRRMRMHAHSTSFAHTYIHLLLLTDVAFERKHGTFEGRTDGAHVTWSSSSSARIAGALASVLLNGEVDLVSCVGQPLHLSGGYDDPAAQQRQLLGDGLAQSGASAGHYGHLPGEEISPKHCSPLGHLFTDRYLAVCLVTM